MRRIMLVTVVSILCLAPAVQADPRVCDTINDLADGWAVIADALELDADEEVEDLDVARLEKDVNELLPATEDLGDILLDLGNRDEEEMGDELLDVVEDLYDVQEEDYAAYVVDRIDDIVDSMDEIVDYCDEVNE